MWMFSVLKKTGTSTGVSLPGSIERFLTFIKPIEFKPDEHTPVRRESSNKFSEELV
jgi:hypothetical protein